jgi:ATP-dependent 26S proteasome regulatory subunit
MLLLKKTLINLVDIPLPEPESIRQLLTINLGNLQLGEDVDLDALAARLKGYSGADITSVRKSKHY